MFILAVGLILVLNGQAQSPNQAAQSRDLRTWYQAYDAGVAAFNKGDWEAAIASLMRAQQLKPKSGRKVQTTSNNFVDYLPDYYLGLAYYYLKQYMMADIEFNDVKRSNLIKQTDKEYATFNDTATKAGRALFDQQEAEALALVAAGKRPAATFKVQEASMNAYADPKRLANLRERVYAVNPPKDPATPAGTPNPPAGGANTTNPPAGGATGTDNPPVTNNPPTTGTNPPAGGNTGQPATTASTSPSSVGRANQPSGRPAGAPATSRSVPPNPQQNTVPPTSPVPTPSIPNPGSNFEPFDEPGVRLFFSGQYQEARDFFMDHLMGPGNSARDLLYLACSQAALVLTGRADPSTLSDARYRYGQAMMSYREFDEDLKLISPKILKLLQAK